MAFENITSNAGLAKIRNHNLKLEQENNELKQKLKQYEKNANDLD